SLSIVLLFTFIFLFSLVIWNFGVFRVCLLAGTRLVQKCGKKPEELCTSCESGTFTTVPGVEQCQKCTECTEFQQVQKACTSTHDTVCVCQKGYRCSDPKCSSCELQCPEGQELVGGSCQPCPEGTFQNGTQRTCIAWTKKYCALDTKMSPLSWPKK
uniref:Tumor necrosis factor receptor superfamily, member 9b n=1 Tax=Scleropages formosus TaxID=113540 RepID=A0A8C9WR50_SCLFO